MSETSDQIFAESLPLVSNPPKSTTRSPEEVRADVEAQRSIVARYIAALKSEGKWYPLDGKPLTALKQVQASFTSELAWAYRNNNT
jgi:hypothetical protein